MGIKEPYQKVALWFLIFMFPYEFLVAFLLWKFLPSFSSDFKQWSFALSIILYGVLYYIILLKVKSRVPSINKVSDKKALFSGAKYLSICSNEPSVTIIYEGGNQKKKRLISTLHLRRFKSDILELWREWKEVIPEKDKITQFEFPKNWQKHIIKVVVNPEKIEVVYTNGETKIFQKNDIKKYSYHPFSRSGAVIKFQDGTRLEDLDRVSYWPVLQDIVLEQIKS